MFPECLISIGSNYPPVCRCVCCENCVYVCVCMFMSVSGTQNNLECHFSGAVHFVLFKMVHHWPNMQGKANWPASPWTLSFSTSPVLGYIYHHMPGFFIYVGPSH